MIMMKRERYGDYYRTKAVLKLFDGNIQCVKYCDNMDEFNIFRTKTLEPAGITVICVEEIHEPTRYYS